VLYQVVRDHFETFREQAAGLRDGEGLPRFVEQEFREFLRGGCLAGRRVAERLEVSADHLIQHPLRGRPRLVHRRWGGHAMPVAQGMPGGARREA